MIKTSTEEIQHSMDIECVGYAEYIFPCAINILSEDDIIVDFVTNVSMAYLFIYLLLCEMRPIILNFNSILVTWCLSLLGMSIFGRKVRYYGT